MTLEINKQELEGIIATAVAKAVAEAFRNPELHCRYKTPPDRHDTDHYVLARQIDAGAQHEEEHVLLRQALKNFGKINDIKFSVIRWAVIAVIALIIGWAGIGISSKFGG